MLLFALVLQRSSANRITSPHWKQPCCYPDPLSCFEEPHPEGPAATKGLHQNDSQTDRMLTCPV